MQSERFRFRFRFWSWMCYDWASRCLGVGTCRTRTTGHPLNQHMSFFAVRFIDDLWFTDFTYLQMCWQSLTMVFLMLTPHVLMFEFTHHQSSSFLYWFHFPFRPWCGTRIRTSPSWIQMGIVGDASRQCTWVHLARLGQFIADITIAASARRQRAHPVLNWYCSGW